MPFIYPNIYALNIQLIRTVMLHAALGIKLYLSCRVKSLRIICGRADLRLLGYKPMCILLRYRVPVSWTESSWCNLQVLDKLRVEKSFLSVNHIYDCGCVIKFLLLRNCLADWSQILCGASMGWENESLYNWSKAYDQDGRHAHIW